MLALGVLCSALGLVRIVEAVGSFGRLPPSARLLLAGLATASIAVVIVTLYGLARRSWPDPRPPDLRAAFVLLVLGSLLYPAVIAAYSYGAALLWFGGLSAVWAVWLQVQARWLRGLVPRGARVLDVAFFNVSLGLLLLYFALLAAAWLFPSSLLSVPGSADRLLETSRCAPGTLRFGFACNSLGYFDEELEPVPGVQVSVIGDSFTLGIVPHPYLFTTVAEELTGFRIDSFGVARTGLPEYRIILQGHGLSADPDIVVIAVFIGNDVAYSHLVRARHQGHVFLRSWLDRNLNPLWTMLIRLRRLAAELRSGRELATLGEAQGAGSGAGSGGLEAKYPWISDYRLEKPTFSQPTFIELEQTLAAAICHPGATSVYPSFFEDLAALAAISEERMFAVMLIPDEFQVEDQLWEAVVAGAKTPWDRDLPQKMITAWLDAQGIPYLDLLPVFREFPAEPDGHRHLYHARDTHLNARGNRLAGRQLAALLETLVRSRSAKAEPRTGRR